MPDNLTNGPSYTTPTVNPQETSSVGTRPEFEYAQNPALEASEKRLHPDITRHPENMRFTKNPINRSK